MLTTENVVIGNVAFEPGCHNNWHIHYAEEGGGQILLCTAGRGYYQEWGKDAQELPNWWFDMPVAVYSFLDGYDFTGKTIIPFCTHSGSRFSDTISTLEEYLPDFVILEGFEVYGEDAVGAQNDVQERIRGLDIYTNRNNV